MSRIDAKDALAIYRHFCKQTERVVEYLGVARKLQNLLNVPIPNLRHVRQVPITPAGYYLLYRSRHPFPWPVHLKNTLMTLTLSRTVLNTRRTRRQQKEMPNSALKHLLRNQQRNVSSPW